MRQKILVLLALVLPLAGCEVPVIAAAEANDAKMVGATRIEFPARLLVTSDQFGERLYSGTMIGHISGRADIELQNEDGERCLGTVAPNGKGQISCWGRVWPIDAGGEAKATFSGANYEKVTVQGRVFETAFGWGKGAQERVLQHVLAVKRDLTSKEARSIAKGG